MFETTVAGSLPKPIWLAETERIWPAWKLEGAALEAGKLDATVLAIKLQEDAGVDIVSDGEQARMHFVHGFLANLDGIDFQRRQVIGIRADRYKAEVPDRHRPHSPQGLGAWRGSADCARPYPPKAQIYDAGPDDDRRHDRRRALSQPRRSRPRFRAGLERGGA